MTENTRKKPMIIFTGGGTGGSVTPLLAVIEELVKDDEPVEFIFIGTTTGPENELIKSFLAGPLKFIPISSGKWRRYFSFLNFTDSFKIIKGFFQAIKILNQYRPSLVVSAGSFVSVPVVLAAALKKIPVMIHQQDVRPGLANKLMAPFARVISVTFEKSLLDYGPRAILVGNPIKDLSDYKNKVTLVKEKYHLNSIQPLVLVIGGGTGSKALNDLIFEAAATLNDFCQLVILTGRGKKPVASELSPQANYQVFEFLPHEEVLSLMAAADLVISRCGLGVLTELAALNKSAILLPLPHSHQEDNAALFEKAAAAVVLDQNNLRADDLSKTIKNILADQNKKEKLSQRMSQIIRPGAAAKLAGIIWEIVKK